MKPAGAPAPVQTRCCQGAAGTEGDMGTLKCTARLEQTRDIDCRHTAGTALTVGTAHSHCTQWTKVQFQSTTINRCQKGSALTGNCLGPSLAFAQAQQECAKLTTDGGGWRLCTAPELATNVCCGTGTETFKNQWDEPAFTDSAQCLSDKHYTWTLDSSPVLGFKQTGTAMCTDAVSLDPAYGPTSASTPFYEVNKRYTAAECMAACKARVTGTSAFFLQTVSKGELVNQCGCSQSNTGACPTNPAPASDYCAANHYIAYQILDPDSVSSSGADVDYLTARGNRAFAADSPTGRHWQGGLTNCPFQQLDASHPSIPASLRALVPTIPCGMSDCATYPSGACNMRVSNYCMKIKEVSEHAQGSILPEAAKDLSIDSQGRIGACMEWNTAIDATQGQAHLTAVAAGTSL